MLKHLGESAAYLDPTMLEGLVSAVASGRYLIYTQKKHCIQKRRLHPKNILHGNERINYKINLDLHISNPNIKPKHYFLRQSKYGGIYIVIYQFFKMFVNPLPLLSKDKLCFTRSSTTWLAYLKIWFQSSSTILLWIWWIFFINVHCGWTILQPSFRSVIAFKGICINLNFSESSTTI